MDIPFGACVTWLGYLLQEGVVANRRADVLDCEGIDARNWTPNLLGASLFVVAPMRSATVINSEKIQNHSLAPTTPQTPGTPADVPPTDSRRQESL